MRFINLKTKTEEAFISHPTILCLGNFDGVHIGHRQLVASVLQNQTTLKSEYPDVVSGAWFFDSNFYKTTDEIYSLSEKLDVFADLGLEYAIIANFDEMKGLSPSSFVCDVLKRDCKCIHAVCGENFRFGSKASGNPKMLSDLMCQNATVLPLLTFDADVVSSTYIRSLLANGAVEKANELLSQNYSICESVVHGKALGRKLGIPTINQNIQSKSLILKNGIYATVCTLDGHRYYGVTNVGVRPTVESSKHKNIETYIIGFDGDCYDKLVKIEFVHRIRDEMKFDSIDALKSQIESDISATKSYFKII